MKNYKGGYKLIDLEKNDMLSIEVGVVIKGIHKAIESSYGKPLLLTGIVIDGVEKNDVYIEELKVDEGDFVFKAYGYEITIDDEDNVEAVEIHVPEIKSVTSAAETKDIDIQDGDEYLLSSTRENGTKFIFPNECYISGIGLNTEEEDEYLTTMSNHGIGGTNIGVKKDMEIYIKRVGNVILCCLVGFLL